MKNETGEIAPPSNQYNPLGPWQWKEALSAYEPPPPLPPNEPPPYEPPPPLKEDGLEPDDDPTQPTSGS